MAECQCGSRELFIRKCYDRKTFISFISYFIYEGMIRYRHEIKLQCKGLVRNESDK